MSKSGKRGCLYHFARQFLSRLFKQHNINAICLYHYYYFTVHSGAQVHSGTSPRDREQEELNLRRGRRSVCYGYNVSTGCQNGPTCRFKHVCSISGGDHRRFACRVNHAERDKNKMSLRNMCNKPCTKYEA